MASLLVSLAIAALCISGKCELSKGSMLDIFDCPKLPPLSRPARNVYELRPKDIKVVMALGDSITAGKALIFMLIFICKYVFLLASGFGMMGAHIPDVAKDLLEYRVSTPVPRTSRREFVYIYTEYSQKSSVFMSIRPYRVNPGALEVTLTQARLQLFSDTTLPS